MLFLDELAEFDRPTLDALRQPLEEGVLMIARARGHVRYLARFQLVAAMNPCRCGYANDLDKKCSCSTGDPERYVRRVSGPLIDRLDIQIEMARVPPAELLGGPAPEASAPVRSRIAAARNVALERNGGRPNAQLTGAGVLRASSLTRSAHSALAELAATNHFSARSVHRVIRVARTIADLDGKADVTHEEVLSAGALRDPGASLDDRLAA